jgi:hypothetical protein
MPEAQAEQFASPPSHIRRLYDLPKELLDSIFDGLTPSDYQAWLALASPSGIWRSARRAP